MDVIDLVLRTMAATQLVFLALLLLRRSSGMRALRFAAFLPLGLASFMATSAPNAQMQLGALTIPLTLICVANPVWFWIFTQALFDDDFRLEARHYVALAVMMALGGWHELVLPFPPQGPVDWLFQGAVLTFVALAVARVLDGKSSDLIESRRRSRSWFVVAVGIYCVLAIVLLLAFGGQIPYEVKRLNIVFIFGAAVAVSLLFAARAPGETTTSPTRTAGPSGTRSRPSVDTLLLQQVRDAMEVERLYRRENLTVAALALAIGSQEYLVRRAINGGLGYRNFNELLHHYRLKEAAARLLSQPHLPILTIALDVGYGSIGPFNRAFRSRFGKTPTEYRTQPRQSDVVPA